MNKKNILLIPTTDNIITNWSDVYKYLGKHGHTIYIISDNRLISKEIPNEFYKIDSYILKLQQLEKLNILEQIIIKLYANIYIKHILKQYKIDIVIVSNDNPAVQNICINQAKRVGIKTILHQAAGIFKKPVSLIGFEKLNVKLRKIMFNDSSCQNIGNDVDLCLIQGKKWIDYIDNRNYKIVGNEYYRTLKEKVESIEQNRIIEFKNNLRLDKKRLVAFFSQPFNELKMSSSENIKRLYNDIKFLENKLHESGKYLFVFKPHPQEFYYKSFSFENIIEQIDLNLLIAASDINVTLFSTMAIQSRVLNKKTVGYLPNYFADDLLNQMKMVFDASSNDIKEVYRLIDGDLNLDNNDFFDIVDLTIDTKKVIEEVISQ